MPQGKAVSGEVQWIVVRLSTQLGVDDIAMYTNLNTRTVRRILAYFKKHGDIDDHNKLTRSVRQQLCDYDVQVRFLRY
jgi:hypothetical protein